MTRTNSDSEAGTSSKIKLVGNCVYCYVGFIGTENSQELAETLYEAESKVRGANPLCQNAPILLRVQSDGGDPLAAFSIADQIQRIGGVYTIVEGCAASAATLITTAGARRFITPNGMMLVHQPEVGLCGRFKYSETRDASRFVKMLKDRIIQHYVATTKMDEAQVGIMIERDWWIGAIQCVEYGLVDEILV